METKKFTDGRTDRRTDAEDDRLPNGRIKIRSRRYAT